MVVRECLHYSLLHDLLFRSLSMQSFFTTTYNSCKLGKSLHTQIFFLDKLIKICYICDV